MKKVFFLSVLLFSFFQLSAQNNSVLQEYVGKYSVTIDGYVEDAKIVFINDSTLSISASVGYSYIRYVEKDKFNLTDYPGTITFTRNESNKIKSLIATIPDAGIDKLEAKKEE